MREPRPNKRVWPWVVLLGASLALMVAAVGAMFAGGDAPPPTTNRITVKPNQVALSQAHLQAMMEAAKSVPAADPAEEARQTIERHRARIDSEPDAPERPALFHAMGNLYRQKLLDYGNAAWCYEQIIQNYPKWEGVSMVYGDLATCYEKMNDQEKAMRIYMEMMRVLPENTQEYLYAKDKLGL